MARRTTDITVSVDDFEMILMREAIIHKFIDGLVSELVSQFKDEIIAGIDKELILENVKTAISDKISDKIAENALAKLGLK